MGNQFQQSQKPQTSMDSRKFSIKSGIIHANQQKQCARSTMNSKRHYLKQVLNNFGCQDFGKSAIMNKLSYSPGKTDIDKRSRSVSPTTETRQTFYKHDPQPDVDASSLPQSMHELLRMKYPNDISQTYCELKNCLNMKEFKKHYSNPHTFKRIK